MTKHTPGPWSLDGSYVVADPNVSHPPRYVVVAFVSEATYQPLGSQEANARLIAAGPDMLEALQAIEGDSTDAAARDIARSAISKAKGEG